MPHYLGTIFMLNSFKFVKFAVYYMSGIMNIKLYLLIQRVSWILIIFILIIHITGCAKIGAPTGGPIDITPPKVLQSTPARGATNYKGKDVEITFDEFFQLLDVNKQFVSSPPLKKTPLILIRGKNLVIRTEEKLQDSSTYRYYFGDAIADLNQKNILKNYDFVFSTGGTIDSLSLRGRVVNAFDHLPDKDSYYVMLYDNYNDTIPRKTLPKYITKTDPQGWFSITYVKAGTYMIFALKDFNQNYLFDLPNEAIAFSDTLIKIDKNFYIPDSLVRPDTLSKDTSKWSPFKSQVQLYSFAEYNERQYLKRYERTKPEKFSLIFNLPVQDSLPIRLLNVNKPNWITPDFPTFKKDSMEYWITDTSLVFKDTVKIQLTYHIPDSSGKLIVKYDTISLINKRPPALRKRAPKVTLSPFAVSTNLEGSSFLDLNKKLTVVTSHPLASIDRTKIQLLKLQDNKKTKINFKLYRDSAFIRHYHLDFKLEPQTEYQLIADSAAFTSIYNQVNDSIGFSFSTQRDDYYGDIKLILQNISEQVVIQMIESSGIVSQEKIVTKDQTVTFNFLTPGKYRFKAIYDRNKNGKWDTGDFAEKLQPEKIIFLNKELQVRSNWSIEETWPLE